MDADRIAATPAKSTQTDDAYDSQNDSGDDLFADYNDTMATLPLTQPLNPGAAQQTSPYFGSSASALTTQPTQILDTPIRDRTDSDAVVQVPASSPTHSQQPPSSPPSDRPHKVAPTAQHGAGPRIPMTSGGRFSDDSPPHDTSEDELCQPVSKSDIKPSTFVTKSKPRYRIPPPKDAAPSPFQQTLASFAYNGSTATVPQKRSSDELASAYSAAHKRPRTQPRQTGPARAQPVAEFDRDMTLNDISDFMQMQKVKRMTLVYPDKPVSLLYEALVRKKGQYEDALSYVCELEEKEKEPKPRNTATVDLTEDDASPTKSSKFTTNKSAQATKSIASKYGSALTKKPTAVIDVADDTSDAEAPAVKPRGRLIRGRRPAAKSPSPQDAASPKKPLENRSRKKAIAVDSDSDSDASRDDEPVDQQAVEESERSLLEFLNECSAAELADLSEKSLEDCRGVLERRPFKSLNAFAAVELNPPKLTKTGKVPRTYSSTGTKILNDAQKMWEAYESINELVDKCKDIGDPIKAAMARFGGIASDASGEMNTLKFDDSKHDSGVGTPGSPSQSDDEDHLPVTKSRSAILQKPSIMADDLELKDYQVVALNWLNTLWTNKVSGILADDMGLGKTCQVISFLAHLKETGQKGPHLIVVPNSTLENWMREFAKFVKEGEMLAVPYYGEMKDRSRLRTLIEDQLDDVDVVVTTYGSLTSTDKRDTKFLRRLNPTVCVFDEGHELKNVSSQKHQGAMMIPAQMRLLLTGTPLQNNLQEMTSLLSFIMPEVFAEHAESLNFIFRRKATTTETSTHESLLSASRTAKARTMMTPFILRRKKEQVLGKVLPMKTSRVEYCELDPKQKKVYQDVLSLQRQAFERKKSNVAGSGSSNYLMKLRLTACHPLLDRNFYDDDKIMEMAKAHHEVGASNNVKTSFNWLKKLNDYKIKELVEDDRELWGQYEMKEDLKFASGKFQKTVEFVKQFQKTGDRVLFFSQFRMVLDVMGDVLTAEGIPYLRFDGSTGTQDRQTIIDQFTEDEEIPIFMVSTGAGGTGVNITAANKVIIHDLSWNPQEDVQAENRAHRVGQKRDVEVIRLVTRGTIEEQILALGESKLKLDDKVAGTGSVGDDAAKTNKAMQNMVEQMLMEQMEAEDNGGPDIAKQFKSGMLDKGVKMAD